MAVEDRKDVKHNLRATAPPRLPHLPSPTLPSLLAEPSIRMLLILLILFTQSASAAGCQAISSSGSYQLTQNGVGAPNSASPLTGSACIKINASNVLFDCNGYNISNNGTTGVTYGVSISSASNVTVRNCRLITGYRYGIYLSSTGNSSILNNTITSLSSGADSTSAGILLTGSSRNKADGNIVHDYTSSSASDIFGIDLLGSSNNNNITSNQVFNIQNTNGVLGRAYGYYVASSTNERLINNTDANISGLNLGIGFTFDTSTYSMMENNTATNDSHRGFDFYDSTSCNATGNTARYHYPASSAPDSGLGFYVHHSFGGDASNHRLINNTAYNNSNDGIFADGASGLYIANNTVFNNTAGGIWLTNCFVDLNNDHLYNNGPDLDLEGTLFSSFSVSAVNETIDNPKGDRTNFTSLSLTYTSGLSGIENFAFKWAPQPPSPPLLSFKQKFINETHTCLLCSIDSLSWGWDQSEVGFSNESSFKLYRYDGSSWSNEGATLDTSANTLTKTTFADSGIFGILQNNVSITCPVINSSGTYTLTQNLQGSPNDAAPLANFTCVKINASNVVFDCAGYNITGNSSTGTTYGILPINASNVTVKNCHVSNYTYGIDAHLVRTSTLSNNTAYSNTFGICLNMSNSSVINGSDVYGNTDENIILDTSYFDSLDNNYAHSSISRGIRLLTSSYNNITNNRLINNTPGLQLAYGSTFNRLVNNTANNNSNYGFRVFNQSNDNTFINNTACYNINTSSTNGMGFRAHLDSHRNNFTGNIACNNSINGFDMSGSDNNTIYGNKVFGNGLYGIYLNLSSRNTLDSNNVTKDGWDEIAGDYSNYTVLTRNNVTGRGIEYGNADIGMHFSDNLNISYNRLLNANSSGILISASHSSYIVGNYIANSYSHDGIDMPNNTGSIVLDNNITNASLMGIRCDDCLDVLINNSIINSAVVGIGSASMANSTVSSNNVSATQYGLYLIGSSSGYNLSYNLLFNNSYDLYLADSSASPTTARMINTTITNPAGTLQNLTVLSLDDSIAASSAYSINWTVQPAALPANTVDFHDKYINIANQSGPLAIDSMTWPWNATESIGFDDHSIELWRYDTLGWHLLNSTPDWANRRISLSNINVSGTYALLERTNATCPIITDPGTYYQSMNLSGAPNSASEIGSGYKACVKVASSNVVFDCNGYIIQNNGTAGTTFGILLNASVSNVTVRDCIVSNYTYGLYLYSSSNDTIVNNSALLNENGFRLENSANSNILTDNLAFNNSAYGFILYQNSDNNALANNTAYNNGNRGFYLYVGSSYNLIADNVAHDNGNRGFYLDTQCSFNNLTNNTAYNNQNRGFHLYSNSSYNTLDGNIAYNNSPTGFRIESSIGNNLTNDRAFNNSLYGFFIDNNASGNMLVNDSAYENIDTGFFFNQSANNSITGSSAYLSPSGIILDASPGNNLSNCTTYSDGGGILIRNGADDTRISNSASFGIINTGLSVSASNRTVVSGFHFYDNGADLRIDSSASASLINISGAVFDNPAGNLANFTNLSLDDIAQAGDIYSINWAALPGTVPYNTTSFSDKFVDIDIVNGSVSIDRAVWSWSALEAAPYQESLFDIYEYNSSSGNWTKLNASLDLLSHTLSISNLVPHSGFGPFQQGNATFNPKPIVLNGANVTDINNTPRWGESGPQNFSTKGGNITFANISSASLTDRWAAFYGNVSGKIILGSDEDTLVYTWVWQNNESGVVCVSTDATLHYENVSGASGSDIDLAWGFAPSSDDGNSTFTGTNCTLSIGATLVGNSSYADTGQSGGFITCALKRNQTPTKPDMIFCTQIGSTHTLWDNETGDFEMLVPTAIGYGATETYYFYTNLQ